MSLVQFPTSRNVFISLEVHSQDKRNENKKGITIKQKDDEFIVEVSLLFTLHSSTLSHVPRIDYLSLPPLSLSPCPPFLSSSLSTHSPFRYYSNDLRFFPGHITRCTSHRIQCKSFQSQKYKVIKRII